MRILIADDEEYAREGLVEGLSWEELDIDEIMQAVNGQEALRIARWFKPDIVLTDIRMPKMDGICFARELLQYNADVRIIFMSGYMEVEYLRSAIQLSAVDYIEKPIDLRAVRAAISRAVCAVREKRRTREAVENQKELQQQKLVSLLCSKEADLMTMEKLAGEIGFSLHRAYVCLIVQFPRKAGERGTARGNLISLLESRGGQAIGRYHKEKNQFEVILSYEEKEGYRLIPLCQELLRAVPEIKLGVGVEAGDVKNIYNSYRTALAAINCAFYQEQERMFQIDEKILQRKIMDPGIYGDFLAVLSGHPENLESWFGELFGRLREQKFYQKEQVYALLASLVTAVYRQYPEMYGRHPDIQGEEQIQIVIQEMETLREIEGFVREMLSWVQQRQVEQAGYSRVIRGVLDYVAGHYGEKDLSVVEIAEYLHFSPAYLNVLVKQELKVTLKQYLSNYRLDRAKMLLTDGYDKITEIADKCGYANANYFSKVFREATGLTPAEYRNQQEGNLP